MLCQSLIFARVTDEHMLKYNTLFSLFSIVIFANFLTVLVLVCRGLMNLAMGKGSLTMRIHRQDKYSYLRWAGKAVVDADFSSARQVNHEPQIHTNAGTK